MSWSKSTSGPIFTVHAAAEKWADEQKATDASLQPESARAGHQAQIAAAVSAVKQFDATHLGSEVQLNVDAWGHHNGDAASAQGGIKISYYVPVPVK